MIFRIVVLVNVWRSHRWRLVNPRISFAHKTISSISLQNAVRTFELFHLLPGCTVPGHIFPLLVQVCTSLAAATIIPPATTQAVAKPSKYCYASTVSSPLRHCIKTSLYQESLTPFCSVSSIGQFMESGPSSQNISGTF